MKEKTIDSNKRTESNPLSHRLYHVPPLLGREKELAFLENYLDAAQDGQGRFVLLSGEAGMGKTRLVEEFQRRTINSGKANVLTSYCSIHKRNVPYNVFTEMSTTHLANFQKGGEHEVPGSPCIDDSPKYSGRILPMLDSGILEEHFEDADFARRKMFYNVSQTLLQLAEEKPLLIIFKDLHWADASSLQLLHSISRNITGSKILVLLTYRPEDILSEKSGSICHLTNALQKMGREQLSERLELQPLSRSDSNRLINWCLTHDRFTEQFLQSIYDRTKGNPFFTISVLEYMVAEQVIFESEGVWLNTHNRELLGIPYTLPELIQKSLGSLSDAKKAILECAAAVGFPCATEFVSEVFDMSQSVLFDQLRSLEHDNHIIYTKNRELFFYHALVREIIYDSIERERRRALHQKIGTVKERMYKDQIDSKVDELVFHFSAGGDEVKALPYMEQAGERAKNMLAYHESLNYFESAISILENTDTVQDRDQHGIQMMMRAGEMNQALGNWERSLEYFRSVLEISEEQKDEHIQAKAFMKIGLAYAEHSNLSRAEFYLNKSLALFQRLGDLQCYGQTITCIADIHFERGEWQRAWDLYEEALESAMRLVDKRLMARIFNNLGAISDIRGDFFGSVPQYSKSLELYNESEDYLGMAQAYHKLGMVHANKQEWEEAIEFYDRSIALSQKIGELSQMSLTYLLKAVAAFHVSDMDEAEKWACMAGQNLIRVENPMGMAEFNKILGIIGVRKKEWHYAQRRFEESLRIYESCENLLGLAESFEEMGYMYEIRTMNEKAIDFFQKSVNIFEKLGMENRVKELGHKISELSPRFEASE